MQFDRNQYAIQVASDSSDRSKDKSDQKVISIKFISYVDKYELSFVNCYNCLVYYTLQTLRRLAQNREAARKSRLRKKVWPSYRVS